MGKPFRDVHLSTRSTPDTVTLSMQKIATEMCITDRERPDFQESTALSHEDCVALLTTYDPKVAHDSRIDTAITYLLRMWYLTPSYDIEIRDVRHWARDITIFFKATKKGA